MYLEPALTRVVVGADSGVPGEGFIAAEDVPRAQAEVFMFDWATKRPTPNELQEAVEKLPSNGRSLQELLETLG